MSPTVDVVLLVVLQIEVLEVQLLMGPRLEFGPGLSKASESIVPCCMHP